MNISPREWKLAWLAGMAILLGVSYWGGRPRVQEFQRRRNELRETRQQIELAERLLAQRGEIERELGELRARLPRHPPRRDLTTEFLRRLDTVAQQTGLSLARRDPEKEIATGFLYETRVNCTWEGGLEALVRFLHTLPGDNLLLDVRQLTINPVAGATGRLRGNFSVDFIYSREATGETAGSPAGADGN